ncbi:MAG: PASTA domain-containing protein, partial [Solirubrobacteraceae bacterium]|nr:PASTA domain-containing protein [Solirubrobacteraceae bacterium]
MTTLGELPAAIEDATSARLPGSACPLELQVQPSIAAGRRRARFAAVVTNAGATETEARLSVGDDAGAVVARIVPSCLLLEPGQTRAVDVTLRPRRPRFAGRELSRTVSVRARGEDGSTPAARDVVFVQQRLLPLWALALTFVLLAAGAFAATQLPDRVSVPPVEGAPDAATAERTLRAAGLQLDPRLRSRTVAGVAPGTILDQIPDAGARATRGARVTLLVAIGARRAVTPALSGQTPARAAAVLRAAGLTAGPLLPSGASATALVDSQLPAAGRRVP